VATARLGVTIARPVEDVFAVLSNVENVPRWSRSAIEERMLTPGPLRVGSRRRAVVRSFAGRTMVNEAEMIGFEPNRLMIVRTLAGGMTADTVIDFQETDGGTGLAWTTTIKPRGWLSPAGPFLAWLYGRTFQKDLDNLKEMMEAGQL
jgi:uncharacterized protein YndB with AHSA1/START domain